MPTTYAIPQGNQYFNTVLYTGTGASQTISTVGFAPGLMILKDRNSGSSYVTWQDSVRGASVRLFSSLTNSDSTDTNGVSSFTSTGFTLGSNGNENANGDPFVSWNWKANGSGSTNTSGSVTSTVSANTTNGFSVVTYNGPGSGGGTVGHGLGVAPSMIIVKARSGTGAGSESWRVGHSGMNAGSSPWNYYMNLNGTGGQSASSSVWNNTAPTTTVFSISNDSAVSGSAYNMVAYCFAEVNGFSKISYYTGNGSADGPFVYCGFRPRFIMWKRANTSGDGWWMLDSARNTYNVTNLVISAQSTNAESAQTTPVDFLSNGFKLRNGTDGSINASGSTYIYMAFAENPFKYANAR